MGESYNLKHEQYSEFESYKQSPGILDIKKQSSAMFPTILFTDNSFSSSQQLQDRIPFSFST